MRKWWAYEADGGPAAAIEVCNLVEPEIAHAEAAARGMAVAMRYVSDFGDIGIEVVDPRVGA